MSWIFENWVYPARGLVMGLLMFITLLVIVRVGGKRVLTKMNVFDFVFTVAIGSTVASVIMDHSTTWVEGIAAVGILATMQFIAGLASAKSSRLEHLINGSPRLILRDGEMLRGAMKDEKISEEEVLSALRMRGLSRFDQAASVILETDGQFSVIRSEEIEGEPETLKDVEGSSS